MYICTYILKVHFIIGESAINRRRSQLKIFHLENKLAFTIVESIECPKRRLNMSVFKSMEKIVSIGILVDSPTRRVGESFFDYEYLHEYEAQIGTARNVV